MSLSENPNCCALRMSLRRARTDSISGKPLTTHGEEPPGVRTMQERKNALVFSYEDMPDGGRVRIVSSDAKATEARITGASRHLVVHRHRHVVSGHRLRHAHVPHPSHRARRRSQSKEDVERDWM